MPSWMLEMAGLAKVTAFSGAVPAPWALHGRIKWRRAVLKVLVLLLVLLLLLLLPHL